MRHTTTVLLVSLALGAGACSSSIDQKKFDAVNRAGRAMSSTVEVGVGLDKFREVLGAYATEVSLARDHAQSSLEKDFASLHEQALKAYRDSLTIWNAKIDGTAQKWDGGIEATRGSELHRIADEYHLMPAPAKERPIYIDPVPSGGFAVGGLWAADKADAEEQRRRLTESRQEVDAKMAAELASRGSVVIDPDAGIQKTWEVATAKLKSTDAMYRGEKVVPSATQTTSP